MKNILSAAFLAAALLLTAPAFAGGFSQPGVQVSDDPLVWTGANTFDGLMDMGTDEVFDSADTTPNVSTGSLWTSNATGVTITDFDGTPVDGQLLYVRSGGATLYDCTGAGLDCGSADFTTAAGDMTVWMYDGTDWDLLSWARASGDLTVDSDVLHVDAADNFVGFGTATSDTINQVLFLMTGTKDILIDGATNLRNVDIGTMRFEQKPAIENTRALTLNIDANSQPNTHAVVVNLTATGIAAGETISAYDLNIDKKTSTGGVARAFEVSQTGAGSIEVTALHVDPGVAPLSHNSGTFGAIEQAFTFDGAFADTTAAFNATGTDVSLFVGNGDFVYIGDAATFNGISIVLDTFATNPGVKTVFTFSDGGGGWTAFTPSDETQGFRQDGLISWTVSDLAGWATDTVNAVGAKYWIRFARNTSAGITVPIEDIIQIASSTSYGWDEDGKLTIGAINASGNLTMGGNTFILQDVAAGLTANSGGGGVGSCLQLVSSVNEVSTVAVAADSVCLPTAVAGFSIFIINNGGNGINVFPFTSDNLGGGVDTAVSLAAGSNIRYIAFDATNWESI